MTKYKLEYIWLDGYEPVPNLRGKDEDRGVSRRFPSSRASRCWGFDGQLDPAGRRGHRLRLAP
jgi:glutamine synthetase